MHEGVRAAAYRRRSSEPMTRAAALPAQFVPQLATLVKTPPAGDRWLHELKYDGFRIGCRIERGRVQLLSRNGKDWTDRFAPVAEAAEKLEVRQALLDGEVAVLLPDGRTSFQALQNASRAGGGRLVYYVFDLLHLDGENIAALPLEERKARLQRLLSRVKADGVLRYSDHIVGRGGEVLRHACESGAEGIVAKRRDLAYQPGRGPGWQKVKCIQRQEVVIGGFTDPEGARAGIGALLVGVQEDGRLRYAGKVGTGFTQASARQLRQQLERLAQASSPFDPAPRGVLAARAHWVRPQLVAEVQFSEWTDDGKIRHPSFQGLREDKDPTSVVREVPRDTGASPAPAPPRRAAAARKSARRAGNGDAPVVQDIPITHPERAVYPDAGLSKLDVAHYYEWVAAWMVPHVRGRPLTLVRCPDGVGTSCFYMKHSPAWAPAALRRVRIREQKKTGEYLIADSAAALVGLAQMGVLEIHTWGSTIDHLEQPDRVVFDLDPGPEVSWPAMIAAAKLVRDALESLKLSVFLKTTGSRGLHLVVPLVPRADWDTCLAFTRQVAEAVAASDPRRYTTAFAKAGRADKILIDYMRNNRTATAVAPYSTRARPNASVSVPIAWKELTPRLRSDAFTITNLRRRLTARFHDPWADIDRAARPLPRN